MSFFEFVLFVLIFYYLVYVLLWLVLDCNVALWYKSHFGVTPSVMRGQVVWVTGASSGIGRSLALNLARHGVHLALSARRETLLSQVKTECLDASGGLLSDKDVLVLPMDMLVLEKHKDCLEQVLHHFGRLDVLVNNAGRSQRANWEEIDVQVDRELFELDVFSVVHLSRLVVRYFIKHMDGRGHIAVNSSAAGLGTVPFSATYCAAKHAVNAYIGTLVMEHPTINITIFNAGPTATDFLEEAFTAKPNEKVGQSTKDQKRMTAERCGQLFAIAIANKMELVWCGLFPVNALVYVFHYWPLREIVRKFLTKKHLSKIREGKF